MKRIIFPIASIASIVIAVGCESKRSPVSVPTAATVDQESVDSDFGHTFETPQGFVRIDQAFGGESYLDYKLTPSDAVVGEPVEIEVHTGSVYGPVVDVQVTARSTAGSRKDSLGYLLNPLEGEDWTDAAVEGVYVQVVQDGDETLEEIRFDPSDSGYQEYAIENRGHTRFVASVTPTVEKPLIELRWYSPEMEKDPSLRMIADQALQVYPAED